MLRFVAVIACTGVLVSCATKAPAPVIWVRLDGQKMTGNPVLEQKFQTDRTVCMGETQKASMSGAQFCQGIVNCAVAHQVRSDQAGGVFNGCMAEKGYSLELVDLAEAKRAQFEANTLAAQRQATPAPSKKR